MSEALWTSSDIAAITGGTCSGNWPVNGIHIDSRLIESGDLFIALPGENTNGHRFVAQAIDNGASGVLVSELQETISGERQIVVADVEEALVALAKKRREQTKATIIAVTGSVGKTSTKEMLARVLGNIGKTHATVGNYNNHLGVPITLARMPLDTEFAVLEMGMNHAGEIAYLTKLARPHIGIITSVNAVHTEFFDNGIEDVADAKSEIWQGLEHGGVAILPHDNALFEQLLANAQKGVTKQILTFGMNEESDLILRAAVPDTGHQAISIEYKGEAHKYQLGLRGEHQASNSCAVVAALIAVKVDLAEALPHLLTVQPPKGRGRMLAIDIGDIAVHLIDDSYNASPASMRAAIKMLAEEAAAHDARSIAILGDMLELGEDETSHHVELLSSLTENGISDVFTCGERMHHLHVVLPDTIKRAHEKTPEALAPHIESALQQGDVLLVKGSHGSHMWKLVERWVE